jgi:hypothetical protein
VVLKEEIRLTIWTRADSIAERKSARISFSRDAENKSLAIRVCKEVAIPKLREVHRRLPSAGNAKLRPINVSKACG